MKATAKKTQAKFEPIELTITIESEQEKRFLYELFGSDYSIPEMFVKDGKIDEHEYDALSSMMHNVFESFYNK